MARFYRIAVAAAFTVVLSASANATTVFAPTGAIVFDHDPNKPVNLGNVFTPTANVLATSLGFYNPTNLVGGGETVALYNSAGSLLTQTFVNVLGNNAGHYSFGSIAPILLTAGQQYTVVNFVGANAWAYGSVIATGATFNYDSYAYGPSLAFTTNTGGGGPAYLGPNLTVEAVPEPATWAMLLLGFGMIGFAMRKRSNVRTTVAYA